MRRAIETIERARCPSSAVATCLLAAGLVLGTGACRPSPQIEPSSSPQPNANSATHPSSQTSAAPTPPAGEAAGAVAATSAKEVTVQFASWDETQKLVAQHPGKVVVLDIWSTYCVPCMREFPGLVRLQQDHPDQVVAISLNCNYAGLADEPPQHAQEAVEDFLRKQHATITNVISTDSDEKLFERLQLGSVPAVLVYDQQGQLHKRFDNDSNEYGEEGFTYAKQIVPLVEALLKSGGAPRS